MIGFVIGGFDLPRCSARFLMSKWRRGMAQAPLCPLSTAEVILSDGFLEDSPATASRIFIMNHDESPAGTVFCVTLRLEPGASFW